VLYIQVFTVFLDIAALIALSSENDWNSGGVNGHGMEPSVIYIKGNGGSCMQFYQSVKVGGTANYSAAPPVRGAFHIPLRVP